MFHLHAITKCKTLLSSLRFAFIIAIWWVPASATFAQCNDWSISAQVVSSSTCAANGSIQVTASGPDAANLTNIQYGIPLGNNGFSIPLNNSASLVSIPQGAYSVSAVATCNGTLVGKNTTVTMPGSYIPPILSVGLSRATLNCGAYGRIYVSLSFGMAPFTIQITNAPPSYTGPTSFTSGTSSFLVQNLPTGSYTIQVVDACGSGTAPASASVPALVPASVPLILNGFGGSTCNVLSVHKPVIQTTNTGWGGYEYSSLFSVSVQVGGGTIPATPVATLDASPFSVALPAGTTLKDYYGQNITYTIIPPCGSGTQILSQIPFPYFTYNVSQNCNIDFVAHMEFMGGPLCYPVSYTLLNAATATTYGPFTTNNSSTTTPSLPIGSYSVQFTASDGYTGTGNISVAPVTGNPYSVQVISSGDGLHNYIDGFLFSTTGASSATTSRTVELFNGPAGYWYMDSWVGNTNYRALENHAATVGNLKFTTGTYVWKITDNCGTYYLPITVGPQDLYQFTVAIDSQKQTCQGLQVWPSGTATRNGQALPVKFSVLFNGQPMYQPGTYIWPQYGPGTPFLINMPGVYTIVPSAATTTLHFPPYPNVYTTTLSFSYTHSSVGVDMSASQAFLCKGALPGQAQVYVRGRDGIPFSNPVHYTYSLAMQGQGATGPYIATNTSGVFTGFGGNANSVYDVKVTDSCGAFAVQPLKVLDLQSVRLISSSSYVSCLQDSVVLSAVYLPNATYSWTGPGNFTSNQRSPVIYNVGPQHTGVYYVTVVTPQCNLPATDSTVLVITPNPPKPLVSLDCTPPVSLSVTNPDPAFQYRWGVTIPLTNYSVHLVQPSDANYSKFIFVRGYYSAIAIDSTTGCRTYSDTLYFAEDPNDTLVASVYSPHLQICTGDTTILIAQGATAAISYQWYRNGVVIAGATGSTHATNLPGAYKVNIVTGPCRSDTSDEVTVTVVPVPQATLTASVLDICDGDTTVIMASTAPGYSYTWHHNGSTVAGAQGASLPVYLTGNYSVTVSNGGCVATSLPLHLTVHPMPVVNLLPSGSQGLCPGDTIHFNTPPGSSYTYLWHHNGLPVPNQVSNTYSATAPGTYQVTVSAPYCPNIASSPVTVTLLPNSVDLPQDTVVCNNSLFSIPLSVVPGFDQVLWSNGSTDNQIMAVSNGIWWVTATNACGTFTDTVRINTLADFSPTLPQDTLICNSEGSAVLSVPPALQNVQWSTGATASSVIINAPGTYWVKGDSPCGVLSDSINVSFCKPEIEDIVTVTDTICEGDCISFSAVVANYPQQYTWVFPGGDPSVSTSSSPNVCFTKAGIYQAKLVVSNAGGTDTLELPITVFPKPQPRFKDTSVLVSYKTRLKLPACAVALTADWYLGDSLICENCTELAVEAKHYQSVYHCIVRNAECKDSCDYKIEVTNIPHDIWMPDAFTPNGDGLNDRFRIITDNPNIDGAFLYVYNRWGQQVYMSYNLSDGGWDGTVGGKPADPGTYFWMVKYRITGSTQSYMEKGDVVLVR